MGNNFNIRKLLIIIHSFNYLSDMREEYKND